MAIPKKGGPTHLLQIEYHTRLWFLLLDIVVQLHGLDLFADASKFLRHESQEE